METNECLTNVKWLIERFDELRSTTSSRAAIVISADALIVATATFVLDKTTLNANWVAPTDAQIVLLCCASLTFLCAVGSALCAAPAVATISKFSKKLGKDFPSRLFFSSSETVARFKKDPRKLEQTFRELQTNEFLELALAELNASYIFHYERYNWLKRSMSLLCLALISLFALGIVVLLLAL
jgi:hypothetical protein